MSTIFILGAGFSVAEGFPLVRGLKELVIESIRNVQHPLDEAALRPGRGFEYGEFDEGLKLADPDGTLGFEEVLIELRRARAHARRDDPRHRTELALKAGCVRLLWQRHKSISKISPCYETFAQRFFKSADMRRNAVISFNWDILLERSLCDLNVPWKYYPSGVGVVPVLKPHGSINWNSYLQAGGRCDYPGWRPIAPNSNISFDELLPLLDPDPQEVNRDLRFMLYPGDPELPKENQDLGLVWRDVEEVIRTRDEIVFIGYSLPEYDSYATKVFQKFASSKVVSAYNPSSEHLERFHAVLGREVRLLAQTFEESPYGRPSAK
jgi:hypothetical protein